MPEKADANLNLQFHGRVARFSPGQMTDQGKPAYKVLVVDDESSVRDSIRMLLEFHGHTVETADGGALGLTRLETERFDLVITDYLMHGMRGDQLAAAIKQRHPALPIILATAFADDLKANGTLNGIVDHLLIKPFSMAELCEAVASVATPARQ